MRMLLVIVLTLLTVTVLAECAKASFVSPALIERVIEK